MQREDFVHSKIDTGTSVMEYWFRKDINNIGFIGENTGELDREQRGFQ